MLPRRWRIVAENNTDTNSDTSGISWDFEEWKLTTAGALEYAGAKTSESFTVNTGARQVGANRDNSSALDFGFHGRAQAAITSGTPTGSVDFFIEWSPFDTSTFPSVSRKLLGSVAFTGSTKTESIPISY